jgi:hypothetical protein
MDVQWLKPLINKNGKAEYPPSQKPESFNLDELMKKMSAPSK